MTILKWLVILAVISYLIGLVVLFFAQRAFIFPVPQTARTARAAAGFTEAEEHALATADGEKVIVWHVPAEPGHAVVIYFPGNGDFLVRPVRRFRDITSNGTGLVQFPEVAHDNLGNLVRLKRRVISSMLQKADACRSMTRSQFPGREDVVI